MSSFKPARGEKSLNPKTHLTSDYINELLDIHYTIYYAKHDGLDARERVGPFADGSAHIIKELSPLPLYEQRYPKKFEEHKKLYESKHSLKQIKKLDHFIHIFNHHKNNYSILDLEKIYTKMFILINHHRPSF
jgi:hypothetical protein